MLCKDGRQVGLEQCELDMYGYLPAYCNGTTCMINQDYSCLKDTTWD